jgi:hypothetical protein
MIPRPYPTLLLFTKTDTDGEVLHALVRCRGIVVMSDRDVEVYDASPDADRTHPT